MHGSRLESIKNRLREGIKEIVSWVDLFFISDIHIIGLNLGYEETDLWWVLNKRRRIKQEDPKLINNDIFYYPVEKIRDDILQLLSSFDVKVATLDDAILTRPFPSRYSAQLSAIKQNLNNGNKKN